MGVWCSYNLHLDYKKHAMHCLLQLLLPDWSFIMRMALALANSSAVTHLCLSTSVLAFRWYVRPPLLRTMLQASSVSMCAVAKLIVPRHVWAISACVLQQNTRRKERLICHTTDGMVYLTFIRPTSTSREARRDREMLNYYINIHFESQAALEILISLNTHVLCGHSHPVMKSKPALADVKGIG